MMRTTTRQAPMSNNMRLRIKSRAPEGRNRHCLETSGFVDFVRVHHILGIRQQEEEFMGGLEEFWDIGDLQAP